MGCLLAIIVLFTVMVLTAFLVAAAGLIGGLAGMGIKWILLVFGIGAGTSATVFMVGGVLAGMFLLMVGLGFLK